ncbi:MAG: hypothetical protein R2816_06285 [Flavobacteriaceae bacterium]
MPKIIKLFKNNTQRNYSPANGYSQGNSFGVVYDDVNTFSLFGEINVDVNRNFNLGIKAEYFTYNTEDEEKAWNMPDFEASLYLWTSRLISIGLLEQICFM